MDSQQAREADKNKDGSRRGPETAANPALTRDPLEQQRTEGGVVESTVEQAKTMARTVGDQARNIASNAGATAQDLARLAREQTSVATDTLYQQGTRAGEYLTRNVNEYPLTALLIAGAVGYGLGYLIHSSWPSATASDRQSAERDDRNSGRHRGD